MPQVVVQRTSPLLPVHSTKGKRRSGGSVVKLLLVVGIFVVVGYTFVGNPYASKAASVGDSLKGGAANALDIPDLGAGDVGHSRSLQVEVDPSSRGPALTNNKRGLNLGDLKAFQGGRDAAKNAGFMTADKAALSEEQEDNVGGAGESGEFLHVSKGNTAHRRVGDPQQGGSAQVLQQQQLLQQQLVQQQQLLQQQQQQQQQQLQQQLLQQQQQQPAVVPVLPVQTPTTVPTPTPATVPGQVVYADQLPDQAATTQNIAQSVQQQGLTGDQAAQAADVTSMVQEVVSPVSEDLVNLPQVAPQQVAAVPTTTTVPATTPSPTEPAVATGLYALEARDIDGNLVSLSKFMGKVTIVVNVASACGYTDENYKGLMQTYKKYKPYGLEILGFPCNQFGNQESGTESDIKSFCTSKYHVDFPMYSKIDVNGPTSHPIYQFLKSQLPEDQGGGGGVSPGKDLIWNFQKFIVNKKGYPVKFFYQNYDIVAVETAVYQLLHDAV